MQKPKLTGRSQRNNGVTLVSLVVTIIIMLILAGVTIGIISGSNGILGKAVEAVDSMALAKLQESVELSKAEALMEMYSSGESEFDNLYEYIKDRIETSSNGKYETGPGIFTMEKEGVLTYTDKETGDKAILILDKDGNLVIKQVITSDGKVKDMTTIDSLIEEIELAVGVYLPEYNPATDGTFQELVGKKIKESEEGYLETINGGKIYVNDDGTLVYVDTIGNTTTFVVSDEGKVSLKEMEKPDGTIKDMTTEESFMDEFEKAIKDVYTEYMDYLTDNGLNINTYEFEDYLESRVTDLEKELTTSTGGHITFNEDGTYSYTDKVNSPNALIFVPQEKADGIKTIILSDKDCVTIIKTEVHDNSDNNKEEDTEQGLPAKDLTVADVQFTLDPMGWTNQTILVTAITNIDKEELQGYKLQTSTNGRTWSDNNYQVFEKNGTMYVRLNTGTKVGATATTEITKIEKVKPKIEIKDYTARTITFVADDTSEVVNTTSGVVAWRIATEKGEDNATEIGTSQEVWEHKVIELTADTTYYISALDEAGNWSEPYELKTRTVAEQLLRSKAEVDGFMKNDAEQEGKTNLYEYLLEKKEYEVEDLGRYYIDGDKIYYIDYDTDARAEIVVDQDGNFVVKRITSVDDEEEPILTPDVVKSEIQAAVDKIYKEYKEDKTAGKIPEDKNFEEYLRERIESGDDLGLPNGGKFDLDDETPYFIYIDRDGNETTFITVEKEDHAEVIVKEYKDKETGEVTDLTTERSLQEELEKVLAELREDYEKLLEEDSDKTKEDYGFRQYVEDLAGEEHKFTVPSTGGTITSNGDGTFVYEDATSGTNSIEFTITDDGEVIIGKVSLNPSVPDPDEGRADDDAEEPAPRPTIDLQEGDITIEYSETNWTNQPVTLKAIVNPRKGLDTTGYIIQTSKRPTSGYVNSDEQVYTSNGEFYVRLYNQTSGDKVIASATGTITKIDTVKPQVIDEGKSTSRVVRFKVTDNASGMAGYYVSDSNKEPDDSKFVKGFEKETKEYSGEVSVRKASTDYYVWALDYAGNKSLMTTITTPSDTDSIADKVANVKYQDIVAVHPEPLKQKGVGTFWLNDDGSVTFKDEDSDDEAIYVCDREGNLIVKTITTWNVKTGISHTTDKTLENPDGIKGEIEKVVQELSIDNNYDASKETSLQDYLKKLVENKGILEGDGLKYVKTIFGGKLTVNEAGQLLYEDREGNRSTFIVADNGNVAIQETRGSDGRYNDTKTEASLKAEAEKAVEDLRKEYREEQKKGQLDPPDITFTEWIDEKAEENGGKVNTTTGGAISPNGDGTYTYQSPGNDEMGTNSSKIIITIDNEGNIPETGESEVTKDIDVKPSDEPIPDVLKEGDITFKLVPNTWTNGNVSIEASSDYVKEGVWIQMSLTGGKIGWMNKSVMKVSTNGTAYARLTNGKTYSEPICVRVENIDKIAPQITEVKNTSYSAIITASDQGGSGVAKYMIKESLDTPSADDFIETSNKFEGLRNGKTYYAWVMDQAGNISDVFETKLDEITEIQESNIIYEIYENGKKLEAGDWATSPVTVKVSLDGVDSTNYEIQLSTDGTNWIKKSEIELAKNGTVYVSLVDESGQQGKDIVTIDVRMIDTEKPTVNITRATVYSISFKANDDVSGVSKYSISTSSSTQGEFRDIEELAQYNNTNVKYELKEGTTYYLWVQDKSGRNSIRSQATTWTVEEALIIRQDESQELVRVEMDKDGIDATKASVSEYIKNEIRTNPRQTGKFELGEGYYALDKEGHITFTDIETGAIATLIEDKDGNLIVKTITPKDPETGKDGETEDMTTADSIKKEIEAAMKEALEDPETAEKIKNGESFEKETDHGTLKYDEDTKKWTYEDEPGNTTTFITDEDGSGNGEIIPKTLETPKGEIKDLTTEDSLRKELEMVLKKLKEEFKEEVGDTNPDASFKDWLENKINENPSKELPIDFTGGNIVSNGDGSFIYEDGTPNKNKIEFTVADDGKTGENNNEINNDNGKDSDGITQEEIDSLKKAIIAALDQITEGDTKDLNDITKTDEKVTIDTDYGKISYDPETKKWTYEDETGTKVTFIPIDNGKDVIIKEIETPDGKKTDVTTKEDLEKEVEVAIGELEKEYEKEKEDGKLDPEDQSFKEWLDDKIKDSEDGKIDTPTGGQLGKNEDGTYTYEDYTTPPNEVDVEISEDGNVTIVDTKINTEDEDKNVPATRPTVDELKQKVLDSLKEIIDDGKSISDIENSDKEVRIETEQGTVTYNPDENKWTLDDKDGNKITFIPLDEGKDAIIKEVILPSGEKIDMTTGESDAVIQDGDIQFEYIVDGKIYKTFTAYTNKDITVNAILKEPKDGVIIQSKRNPAEVWNNRSSQTFTANGTFYAQAKVGEQTIAASTNITIIDKTAPTVSITNNSTTGFTLTVNDDISGGQRYFIKDGETVVQEGAYKGNSVTISNLEAGKTYQVYAIDKAGNTSDEIDVFVTSELGDLGQKKKEEVQDALDKIKEQYEKEKEEGTLNPADQSFEDWIKEKGEDGIPTGDGDEKIKYDDDTNKFIHDDGNGTTTTFIPIDDGEDVIVKEVTKPDGTITDLTTEESLRKELEKALEDLRKDYEQEKEAGTLEPADQSFKEWLDKKIEDSDDGYIDTSTAGKITKNEDGSYTYQDGTTNPNTIDFTLDNDGNITGTGKPSINQPVVEVPELKTLRKSDLKFVSDPTDWTCNSVKVTITPTSNSLLATGLEIQTSKNGIIWSTASERDFIENGTLYARLWNGVEGSNSVTTKVENIEKDKPVIEEIKDVTTYGFTIKATDETSGVKGYYLSRDPKEVPTDSKLFTDFGSSGTSISKKIEVPDQGKTYNVWIIDIAGNICAEPTKVVTLEDMDDFGNKGEDLQYANVNFYADKTDWTMETVNVTVSFNENSVFNTGEYTIETTKTPRYPETWTTDTTVTFDENGTLYARIKDAKGQVSSTLASFTIRNIDLEAAEANLLEKTSWSIKFRMRDYDSGIVSYNVTKSYEIPEEGWIPLEEKTTEEVIIDYSKDIDPETEYYVWVKDYVGHVSSFTVTTYAVPILTNDDVTFEYSQHDRWNAAPVSITATMNNIPRQDGDTSHYTLYGGNSPDMETWTPVEDNVFTITFTEQSDQEYLYIGLRDDNGHFTKQYLQSEILTGIDDEVPVITEVEALTSYSFTLKASDSYSGLGGYILLDPGVNPTIESEGWLPLDFEAGEQTITNNNYPGIVGKQKIVWVKDRSGHISTTSQTLDMPEVSNIESDQEFDVVITPDGETNITPISFTFSLTNEIDKYKTDNYEFAISKVADASSLENGLTTTLNGNGHIYLVMKDINGVVSPTPYDFYYRNYDNTAPTITVTGATTNSITYNINDTHTIAGYVFKSGLHGWEPKDEEWIPVGSSYLPDRTETALKDNSTYTIWAKDLAGNVSYKEYNTRQFETIDVSITWDASTQGMVTVTSSNTSNIWYGINNTSPRTDITGLTQYTGTVRVESGSTIYMWRWDGNNLSDSKSAMPCKPSQVTYSLNGGTGGPTSKTYSHLSNVLLTPHPTRVGYTFQGWATTNGGSVVYNTGTATFVMPNTAVNLYAVWKANTNTAYVVQHYQMNTNGSYPSSPNATQNLTGTSDASLTLANLKQNYTGLTYSYGTADGSTTTTTTIAPNGSRVIRLYYTRNKYRFTLGSHAGVNTSGSTGTADVYYGATVTLKGTLNTGYTGNITWTSSNTGLVTNRTTSSGATSTFAMPLGAVTMTPSANLITYTITYDANGGTGAPAAQTKYYGINLTLSSQVPSRSGYTFNYWSASIGGTFNSGALYSVDSSAVMKAIWKSNGPQRVTGEGEPSMIYCGVCLTNQYVSSWGSIHGYEGILVCPGCGRSARDNEYLPTGECGHSMQYVNYYGCCNLYRYSILY